MWHLNHSACSKIQYPPPEILKKNGSLFWPLRSWRLFELINQFAPIDYVHQGRLPSISLAREALFSRFVCLLFLFDAILHSLRARLIGDLAPLLNLFINSSAGGLFYYFFFLPHSFPHHSSRFVGAILIIIRPLASDQRPLALFIWKN